MTDVMFKAVTRLGFQLIYKVLKTQNKNISDFEQRIGRLEEMHGGVSEKIGGTSSDPEAAE